MVGKYGVDAGRVRARAANFDGRVLAVSGLLGLVRWSPGLREVHNKPSLYESLGNGRLLDGDVEIASQDVGRVSKALHSNHRGSDE